MQSHRYQKIALTLALVAWPATMTGDTLPDPYAGQRAAMVELIAGYGIKDPGILEAMRKVPRHRFVPDAVKYFAYADSALRIGEGQTISQPYVVAYMTEALQLKPTDRVLEIGTGSGYQAAVLAEIVDQVYSVEIIESLSRRSGRLFSAMGYTNIRLKVGDGWQGWVEWSPYDAIIVTAAPETIPSALVRQLAEGGRMILPLGGDSQRLTLVTKTGGHTTLQEMLPVRFVPMTGGNREPTDQ